MAGYSRSSLMQKLGYQAGQSIVLLNAPDWFVQELENHTLVISASLPTNWCHVFFTLQSELANFLDQTNLNSVEKGLWVSWPKKASKVDTDITEQTFRDYILPLGWVDTKVCAVDDTWSGLKFLRRKKLNF